MGARIPDHLIAEVRERTDIVEVIGRYVALRRAGSSYKGLCPFHDEKTPSFNVNPSKQFFHCFGCHESGDVFSFLTKLEGKPFIEVVRELAQQSGVELPTPTRSPAEKRRDSEREQCFKLNELALTFYVERYRAAEGRSAREYVASRELSDRVVEIFRLGYAPPGWDALTRLLSRKEAPAALAEKLGLVVRRRGAPPPRGADEKVHPDRHFDFFRDRLLFPVIGPGDRVLAFSGRLLDPEAKDRKYVNSPESPVYHKSETLYGLPAARPAMRRHDRVILVEGNVDVLAMHQAGFEETVAPLGTALTTRQIAILRRYVPEIVLTYDGDSAGRQAARKAAEMLAAEEVLSRVVLLPDGVDPADLVAAQPERMAQWLKDAATGRRFLIDAVARECGDTVEERVVAAESLAPVLARIPGRVEREEYGRQAAAALGLRSVQMERLMRGQSVEARAAPAAAAARPRMGREQRYALAMLALLVAHPRLALRAGQEGVASYVEDSTLRELIRLAIATQAETGRVEVSALLEQVPTELRDLIARALLSDAYGSELELEQDPTDSVDATRAFEQVLLRLRLTRNRKELTDNQREIREATSSEDTEWRKKLILRRIRLSQEKDELTKALASGR